MYVPFHLLYIKLVPNCQDDQGDLTTWSPCSISCTNSSFKPWTSLAFSLLATFIFSCKFPIEFFKFPLLVFISFVVGTYVSSISDESLAKIGKLTLLFALVSKIVFSLFTIEALSTLVFGVTKKLLYKSLAPNCIVAQEAFNFWVAFATFFLSFTSAFSFLASVKISFCFSASCIMLSSEKALVPFIKKSTASPTEYFTFSYLLAIERKFFSVVCRLLFPIFLSP